MPESMSWGDSLPVPPARDAHYDEDNNCQCMDHRVMRGEVPRLVANAGYGRRVDAPMQPPDRDTPFREVPGELGSDPGVFGPAPVNIEQDETPAFMGFGEDGYDWFIIAVRQGKANAREHLIRALRIGGWRQSEANPNIWSKG